MDPQAKRLAQGGEKNLIGITTAEDPPRLLIETPTMQTIFPAYEFVKAEHGKDISDDIHLEFRRYLVVIEGDNLKPLFGQFALNRVGRISETPTSREVQAEETVIRKITIARLDADEEEMEEEP